MTKHYDEDTLLEYALGLLNARSKADIDGHRIECAKCNALIQDIERTLERIREAARGLETDVPPIRRRRTWLRTAAMLAVGFGLGVLATRTVDRPPVIVVGQQIVPAPPSRPDAGFTAAEAVRVR